MENGNVPMDFYLRVFERIEEQHLKIKEMKIEFHIFGKYTDILEQEGEKVSLTFQ